MFSRPLWIIVALVLALGWSAHSGATPANAGFTGANPAQSAYLNLQGSAVLLSPAAAPLPVLGVQASTLPTTAPRCSAFDFTGPVSCSVQGATTRCSMNCDQNGICSALIEAGMGQALCSTHDGNLQRRCSILPPSSNQGAFPMCTTLTVGSQFGDSFCSVFRTTGGCSVENIPGAVARGYCSTSGVGMQCSVFNLNSPVRGFCSVAKLGDKICSADDPGSHCSIGVPAFGACTVFKNAPIGACSAHHGGLIGCSVFGGPGPNANGICRAP